MSMKPVQVLIVDDEEKICTMITDYLNAMGFNARSVSNGGDALKILAEGSPDIVVLDVMMPGLDGFDVLRRIRSISKIPVIMLTARAEEGDKLMGLDLGADDYLVKPFSLKELAARIRAILRRSSGALSDETDEVESSAVIVAGGLQLDAGKMVLRRDIPGKGPQNIDLTSVQFSILKLMMSHPGRVFTRMQLLNSFQEHSFEGYERTIDVHIKNIRKKMGKPVPGGDYISTVYGTGYRFREEE